MERRPSFTTVRHDSNDQEGFFMIEMFVKRPATTIMFVAFFTVLGIVSWFNIPTELMPKIDFPMVTVKVVYPGATPVEVETQIVKKIEDIAAEISDIDKIESYSYENFAFVLVTFNLGANVNIKSIEVKDKVEAIINDLPKNAERPIIEKFDPFVAPVVEFVLSSDKHSPLQLHEFADKILKNKFSTIKGVAEVEIFGGRKRQINVKLDPMLMKRLYLSIEDVIGGIGTKNLNIPGGPIVQRMPSTFASLGNFLMSPPLALCHWFRETDIRSH